MSIDSLFKHNLGMVDRIIRVVLGLILVGNVYAGIQTPIGWGGLILILTGAFDICPIYAMLGINTKSVSEKLGLK